MNIEINDEEQILSSIRKRNFWKEEEEGLLRQWADKAQCYQWMHMRSHEIYRWKNGLYTIPVIIISTITGTANFALDRFGEDLQKYMTMGIGSLSILAGIISTVSQFLKIAELNESHRVAGLSWGKFYRNIKTELSRHPLDRYTPLEFIKMSKEEYNRLVDISPFMPKKVINNFNNKFKKNLDLTKPEICDILSATQIFELSEDERKLIADEVIVNEDPLRKNTMESTNEEIERRSKFIDTFFEINGRHPDEVEINRLLVDNQLIMDFDEPTNTFV
jgi:hypothetical protein